MKSVSTGPVRRMPKVSSGLLAEGAPAREVCPILRRQNRRSIPSIEGSAIRELGMEYGSLRYAPTMPHANHRSRLHQISVFSGPFIQPGSNVLVELVEQSIELFLREITGIIGDIYLSHSRGEDERFKANPVRAGFRKMAKNFLVKGVLLLIQTNTPSLASRYGFQRWPNGTLSV